MSEWKTSPLVSVCTFFGDGDWIESKDQSPEGVRLIQTGNVGDGEFKDRGEKARFVSQDTFTRLRCTEIFAGDCLVSRLPEPAGRACLVPETGERMITAVDCTIVRFDQSKFLPEFFAYYSQSGDYLAAVEREATGTTRKRISRARLGQVAVPLAPLPEQRRIVAILDEAFEAIATAKANAEKNLLNAREVFNRERSAVFGRHARDWPTRPLGEIAVVQSGGTPLVSKKEFWNGDIPWYTSGELNGLLTTAPERSITQAGLAGSNAKVFPGGSLLIGMYDTAALKMSILDRSAAFNQAVAGVMPNDRLSLEFLLHAINVIKPRILDLRRGVRQKNLSLAKIKEILVPLPGTKAQIEVVDHLHELQQSVDRLTDNGQRKLAALDELKRSLLHQGFTGRI